MTKLDIRERPSPNHGSRGEPPNMRPISGIGANWRVRLAARPPAMAAFIAEPLQAGCAPIVASRVGNLAEIIEDGVTGRLTPRQPRTVGMAAVSVSSSQGI